MTYKEFTEMVARLVTLSENAAETHEELGDQFSESLEECEDRIAASFEYLQGSADALEALIMQARNVLANEEAAQ